MSESTEQKRKLFQVAKELNLAHTTLMEFLNSKGFDTPKKHMSLVTVEMYEEIVKKFDQNRWRKFQEEVEPAVDTTKQKEAERHREAEIDRILQTAKIKLEKAEKPLELEKIEGVSADVLARETKMREVQPPAMKEELESEIADRIVEEKTKTKEKRLPEEKEARKLRAEVELDKDTIKEKLTKVGKEISEAAAIAKADEFADAGAEILEEAGEILTRMPGEMLPVDQVVAEALELAKRKKIVFEPPEIRAKSEKEAEATKGLEEGEEKTRKRRRGKRKKKPRRPETLSPAAIGLEREKRAKKPKKAKGEALEEEEAPRRRRRKGRKRKKIDAKEIDASIKETLARLEDKGKGKKRRRKVAVGVEEEVLDSSILEVTEFISAQELANLMDVNVTDVIRKAMEMGLLISINQRLDQDTITLLADEFGFTVKFISSAEEYEEAEKEEEEVEEEVRAPVVTVMGHVDHGKTSLLDYIRRSNIIAGEAGGITQHIGAYKLQYEDRYITFLDTPGHEAFTAMRARGAQVTDIVVLVIAADDQVMPQTLEAISHAQAAKVPIIIAINKIDKPNAQPEKVKQQLADHNILVEDWGGKYQCVEISAKFGVNVEKLMDEILLLADLLELKAARNCRAKGVIIDSKLDRGRGALASVLIERGTLLVGDYFVADQYAGKVRALLDERGNKIENGGPSDPIVVLGFEGIPQAGENFFVTASEKEARGISLRRQQLQREQSFRQIKMITLDQISDRIKFGEVKELPLLIKGDVHGSVEAIADSLMKLKSAEVGVNVIHRGVGAITESDVLLASASHAVIIGFHVLANKKARELALREQVEIKSYRIIYDVVDDVKKALEGLLRPEVKEEIAGEIEVREVFKISALGSIAGCYVLDGKVERTMKIKVYRGGVEIFDGELDSLKRFKDDVKEVNSGFECGIKIKNFNDVKVGDVIEPYKIIETKRVLNM